MTAKTKLILIVIISLPFVLFFGYFALIIVSIPFNYNEPVRFLIPSGYRGEVMILFDQRTGQDPKYEDKWRVYEIDSTGVLMTKFKDKAGIITHEFYYVDSLGNRTKLDNIDPIQLKRQLKTETDPFGVMHLQTGQDMMRFYVCKYNDLKKYVRREYQLRFDSLERVYLK